MEAAFLCSKNWLVLNVATPSFHDSLKRTRFFQFAVLPSLPLVSRLSPQTKTNCQILSNSSVWFPITLFQFFLVTLPSQDPESFCSLFAYLSFPPRYCAHSCFFSKQCSMLLNIPQPFPSPHPPPLPFSSYLSIYYVLSTILGAGDIVMKS